MATISKLTLSGGSGDGRAIKVAPTSTPGVILHTGPSTASEYDEVWLYAMNTDTAVRKLTLEWGSTVSPDDLIEISLPSAAGLVLVVPGLLIRGNASPLVIRAFANEGNVVTIHGYVNRIA